MTWDKQWWIKRLLWVAIMVTAGLADYLNNGLVSMLSTVAIMLFIWWLVEVN
jgi:Na+/H+ antiporter NhaC